MEKTNTQSQRSPNTLYAEVTDRIIAELEAGRLPWVQPWGETRADVGMPCNAGTGRRYSGINVLILWATLFERGYSSQRWLTYRQAQALGGNVRKGETGTTVCYADRFTPRENDGAELPLGDGEERRQVAFLKRFTVFNVDQCEGLGSGLVAGPVALAEDQVVEVADDVIAASGVDFRTGGMEAFYMPAQDLVMVPARRAFFDEINAYRTWLHELVHATGHASRLGRDLTNPFGSDGYAREELIAEMGSAFLCAALGIVPTVRHADYIGSWLEVLREDKAPRMPFINFIVNDKVGSSGAPSSEGIAIGAKGSLIEKVYAESGVGGRPDFEDYYLQMTIKGEEAQGALVFSETSLTEEDGYALVREILSGFEGLCDVLH